MTTLLVLSIDLFDVCWVLLLTSALTVVGIMVADRLADVISPHWQYLLRAIPLFVVLPVWLLREPDGRVSVGTMLSMHLLTVVSQLLAILGYCLVVRLWQSIDPRTKKANAIRERIRQTRQHV